MSEEDDIRIKEAEAEYSAIKDKVEKRITKIDFRKTITKILIILFILLILSLSLSSDIRSTFLSSNWFVAAFWLLVLSIVFVSPRNVLIFDTAEEGIFYRLYSAYNYRRDNKNAKQNLIKVIRIVEYLISEYERLPYSNETLDKLKELKDSIYKIYGDLCCGEDEGLKTRSAKWDKVQDLAISLYYGSLFDIRTSNLIKDINDNFRKKEFTLEDEKESLISQSKLFFVDKYNSSWIWRLSTWTVIAAIISLILNTVWSIAPESLVPIVVGIPVAASSIKEIK